MDDDCEMCSHHKLQWLKPLFGLQGNHCFLVPLLETLDTPPLKPFLLEFTGGNQNRAS